MADCGPLRYKVNPVLEWNDVAIEAALVDVKRPLLVRDQNGNLVWGRDQDGATKTSRAMAIAHAAIYNAVVGCEGGYQPYLVSLPARPSTPDTSATVAAAAYYILSWLYPRQRLHLDQAFLDVQKRPGIGPSLTYGYNIAVRVWNARLNDGSYNLVRYRRKDVPGVWRPDLQDPAQIPLDPHWGQVTPFLLSSDDVQNVFSSVPPPPGFKGEDQYDLSDAQYRAGRAEVIRVGADGQKYSSSRTPEDTINAVFWSYDEGRGLPIRLYNQLTRQVVFRSELSLTQQVRLFLYTNLAMADAAIVAWRVKYYYRLWRPIHAAQLDAQEPVAGWIPLGKRPPYAPADNCSPPFPAFISGHSAIGAAMLRSLARLLGTNDCRFKLTSDEPPRETYNLNNFTDPSRLIDASRVQLGVHFPWDVAEGSQAGMRVEELAFGHLPGEAAAGPPEGEIRDAHLLDLRPQLGVKDFREEVDAGTYENLPDYQTPPPREEV
jgi:hypothetical protein